MVCHPTKKKTDTHLAIANYHIAHDPSDQTASVV
jgi:hypothetical protein